MSFLLRHLGDFCTFFAGLAFLVNFIFLKATRRQSFVCFSLAAVQLTFGGFLGLLHGFSQLEYVHAHHWAIWLFSMFFKHFGCGMLIALIILGAHKDFEPRWKVSTP
jgi:hypothetical protein